MKLEQSFEVAAPLDRVWAALIDVERVAPCLPGAEVTGRNDDGSYNGTFRVKVGPTAAAYSGKLEMENIDEGAHTATMQAAGTDRRGQGGAKATIISSVKEGGPDTTVVEVATDYSITGRLARFGRGGMIEEIGNRLLREFAASLQAMLAGPGEYETFVGMPAVGAGGAAKGDKPKPKPRKDLAAAADAVAAASEPAAPEPVAEPVAAEPEPVAAEPKPVAAAPEPEPEPAAEPEPVAAEPEPVAAEPEPEPDVEDLPDLALEAAAEEELAAVMPEASIESEPPAAAEVPQPPAEPELVPPAPEPVPQPAPEPVPHEPAPEQVPPAPEPVPVPPTPEPVPEPEPAPPHTPEPPPEPPAPVPPPAPEPPPPPPPATEAEPLDGLALVRTVIVDRVKSNPIPVVALLLGFLLLRRRRRRGRGS